MKYQLRYLQPAQYESWLRKATDPDWVDHRYRTAQDRAMVSAILELRDAIQKLKDEESEVA